jgi:hypothetical protein
MVFNATFNNNSVISWRNHIGRYTFPHLSSTSALSSVNQVDDIRVPSCSIIKPEAILSSNNETAILAQIFKPIPTMPF